MPTTSRTVASSTQTMWSLVTAVSALVAGRAPVTSVAVAPVARFRPEANRSVVSWDSDSLSEV
jgi:hypothetical protein